MRRPTKTSEIRESCVLHSRDPTPPSKSCIVDSGKEMLEYQLMDEGPVQGMMEVK